ncbi:DNA polymerase III epsilon subunit-like protein [Bradyrhizobium sp. USDA 4341]
MSMTIPPRWWAIDTEGCGTAAKRLIEVSFVELVYLRPTGFVRTWRIDPQGPISPYAVRVHGIRRSDLEGCPTIQEIAPDILKLLEDLPIFGHGIGNDIGPLRRDLPNWKPVAACDTQRLAEVLMPRAASFKLTRVGDALGLTSRARSLTKAFPHSAPFDAALSGLVAGHLLQKLEPKRAIELLEQVNILRKENPKPFSGHSRQQPDTSAPTPA